jgi:glycosyltransferase involved in cell wall biosynthesis
MPNVDVFHNILWSRYKGAVFTQLHALANEHSEEIRFHQIAETASSQAVFGTADLSYHQYPYKLLFKGGYDAIPKPTLYRTLFMTVWRSKASTIVLPGYNRPEHWLMLFATMLTRKKRLVCCDSTIHDQRQSLVKGWMKRWFFAQCHGYLAYGVRSREYLVGYKADPDRVFEPCQAAALSHDYDAQDALLQRQQHAPLPDSPSFLFVGRLAPEKSLFLLLIAFKRIHTKMPDSTLTLIGGGPLRAELEAEVDALGLNTAVRFAGTMGPEELASAYASATCLVLPSSSEPWGLVINEALSYGCPVLISNRCGCLPELVAPGGTGLSFTSGDADDLYRCMQIAPEAFSDVTKTALRCMEIIGRYTPRYAATTMLKGIKTISRTNRAHYKGTVDAGM